jgi:hypothetical protein
MQQQREAAQHNTITSWSGGAEPDQLGLYGLHRSPRRCQLGQLDDFRLGDPRLSLAGNLQEPAPSSSCSLFSRLSADY